VGSALVVMLRGPARAEPPATHSSGARVLYAGAALAANVLPGVSVVYAPQCLPGYVLCKALFAGASVVLAGEQLVLSGGRDLGQTRAILHRGFAGDWYLTWRHAAGDVQAQPLPEPPPTPAG
jgi:hypothetical protein